MATLTTANSALALQIAGLYPVPQLLQGYSADDAFSTDDVSPVEAIMGVDGKLSFGFTPYPTKLKITLQADSASNAIFDNWLAAMRSANDVYIANAVISIPGIGQKYTMTRGSMTTGNSMPGAGKTLKPRSFEITFESCAPSPI